MISDESWVNTWMLYNGLVLNCFASFFHIFTAVTLHREKKEWLIIALCAIIIHYTKSFFFSSEFKAQTKWTGCDDEMGIVKKCNCVYDHFRS
jgi:hypothetical protein